MRFCRRVFFVFLLAISLFPCSAQAYSVLTHQAVVDAAWKEGIQPNLVKRFPNATAEDLRNARANAYGGCIIQDLGYYPFGSKFFTNLVHYVRTADFVLALIKESTTIEEYAFALGALAHYSSDNNGHPLGVNPSVPLIYPKLAVYGKSVTYAQSPPTHLKTEFGFDVLQVAHGNYVSQDYHNFIGFKVSKDLLERAFQDTYSIPLKDVFTSIDIALGTYRKSVSTLIPEATKVAWQIRKAEILKTNPGITQEKYIYRLTRRQYEKDWGSEYEKPGFGARVIGVLVRILPRVGYLRALSFKPPTSESEKLFANSFEASVKSYIALLKQLHSGKITLEEKDFDTGRPIKAGEYSLCDDTYAKLLGKLDRRDYKGVSASLRQNILGFYGDLESPIATKRHKKEWRKTIQRLNDLKQLSPAQNQK